VVADADVCGGPDPRGSKELIIVPAEFLVFVIKFFSAFYLQQNQEQNRIRTQNLLVLVVWLVLPQAELVAG